MKLTYKNQTIDMFANEIPKILTISLSGGLDSASAFYLVSKYFSQIEVIPYTCRDQNAPKDSKAAKSIVKWMQKEFPNNKIQNIKTFDFNDRTEDFVSFDAVDKVIKKYPQFEGMRRTQVSKIIQLDKISRDLLQRYVGAVRLDGMTRNPPDEEMKKLGFYDKAERRRDKDKPIIQEYRTVKYTTQKDLKYNIYQIYANVDKKFVAGVYKENNLMDTLYPLTRSCVGTARQTDNFTKECRECFWCHEKKWAFDLDWS